MDLSMPDPHTHARASADGDVLAWFEAPSAQGALRLAVRVDGAGIRHAADAAIALGDCEPLLAGIDDWAAEPIEWRWRGPASGSGDDDEPAVRSWLVWPGGRAMLTCPLDWLRARAAPQGDWARELALPALAATLVGGRMRVPVGALCDLEVGGAIVLEPSFRPAWYGVLSANGEEARSDLAGSTVALAGVADATPALPRFVSGVDRTTVLQAVGNADDPLCELRLALPNPVAAAGLAGWCAGPVGPAGPAASFWLCGDPLRPARRLAGGQLMPWGDGWALAVQTLGNALPG
ncbi:MAG: hypothetical protein ABI696_00265 [Rubrivivax sp.]